MDHSSALIGYEEWDLWFSPYLSDDRDVVRAKVPMGLDLQSYDFKPYVDAHLGKFIEAVKVEYITWTA